jgi:hypothetical protein
MPQPIDFEELLQQLKSGIASLARLTIRDYVNYAKQDGDRILEEMKEKLKRWTQKLAEGHLSKEDFLWLVASQKDLIEMNSLKQAGLAAIRVEQFRSSVINLIIDTAFSVIKI